MIEAAAKKSDDPDKTRQELVQVREKAGLNQCACICVCADASSCMYQLVHG